MPISSSHFPRQQCRNVQYVTLCGSPALIYRTPVYALFDITVSSPFFDMAYAKYSGTGGRDAGDQETTDSLPDQQDGR